MKNEEQLRGEVNELWKRIAAQDLENNQRNNKQARLDRLWGDAFVGSILGIAVAMIVVAIAVLFLGQG